ncbi:hypothetical protein AWP72_09360, partial [Escherichia coli]
MAMNGVGC